MYLATKSNNYKQATISGKFARNMEFLSTQQNTENIINEKINTI